MTLLTKLTTSAIELPPASCGVSIDLYDIFPKVVTPECFYRESSQSLAWIPAKSMRE